MSSRNEIKQKFITFLNISGVKSEISGTYLTVNSSLTASCISLSSTPPAKVFMEYLSDFDTCSDTDSVVSLVLRHE